MSRGDRLPYAALGGWLIAAIILLPSSLHAQEDAPEQPPAVEESQGVAVDTPAPKDNAGQTRTQSETAPEQPPPPPLTVQQLRPPPPACDERCQAAEEREKDDLIAQRSMASSAEDLVGLTLGQILLGIAGVGLLFYTLHLTRQANRAAIRAAKAAEDAVEATTDTAKQQLRAYISSGRILWRTYETGEPKQVTGYGVAIEWKNNGATPARRGRAAANLTITKDSLPQDFKYPDLATEDVISERVNIGPGQITKSVVGMSPAQAQVIPARKPLFLCGDGWNIAIFLSTHRGAEPKYACKST